MSLPRVWLKMSAGERRPNGDIAWKIQAPCRFMGFVPEPVRLDARGGPVDVLPGYSLTAQPNARKTMQ